MSFEEIVQWVLSHAPMVVQYVLMGLGALVCLGQAYIVATPGTEDDHWLSELEAKPIIGWALRFLKAFSPLQRKK